MWSIKLIFLSIVARIVHFFTHLTTEKVAGYFLIISLIIIFWGFSYIHLGGDFSPLAFFNELVTNPTIWKAFVGDLYANGGAELFSIAITVLIIETLNKRRAKSQERRRLMLQMGSPDNSFALEAVRLLRQEGYLHDNIFEKFDLERANLENARLASVHLKAVFLQRANLRNADLCSAKLTSAKLAGSDLQNADLVLADLSYADLSGANLKGADLTSADIANAIFTQAILPDGSMWTANKDMTEFTEPIEQHIDNVGDFPHTVVIQFRTSGGIFGLGRIDELAFRHKHEIKLGNIFVRNKIGICDGGQMGAGTSEIFMFTNDIEKAAELVHEYLDNENLLVFAKIASLGADDDHYIVHFPQDAEFDFFNF